MMVNIQCILVIYHCSLEKLEFLILALLIPLWKTEPHFILFYFNTWIESHFRDIFPQKEYLRHVNCEMLVESQRICGILTDGLLKQKSIRKITATI